MGESRSQDHQREPELSRTGLALVFFDGNCALCNRSVRFLLEHDRHATLRFASLHCATGLHVQEGSPPPVAGSASILVKIGDEVLRESDAVLRLAGLLPFPWNLLALGRIVPKAARDPVYRWIARHRLRWFGTSGACALMRVRWKDRFVGEA